MPTFEYHAIRAEGDAEVTTQGCGDFGPGGLRVACPPRQRVGFVVGRGSSAGPPFGLSIAPPGRRAPDRSAR